MNERRAYRKPHVVTSVVAIVVDEGERVVLTRRSVPPFLDLWVMPGGKIGLGEPMQVALRREVREEVGIDVAVGGLVTTFEHVTPGADNDHHVILYFRCTASRADLAANPAEVAEARWVPRAELSGYAMPEGTRWALACLFPELRGAAPEELGARVPRAESARAGPAILEAEVNLEYALGSHLHCLVAQIPVRLRATGRGFALRDPDAQWRTFLSVLHLAATGERFQKLHFLVFPEVSLPAARLEDALAFVRERFRPGTVTMFGLEHVPLRAWVGLLRRFAADNGPAVPAVERDLAGGALPEIPVNGCCVAVKEASGRLRVFLEAKSHPFRGEEFLDKAGDLYRGRHFWWFRAQPAFFHFMVLVCLDYLYRDLYGSNLRRIVDHANQQFFAGRRALDALFVLQCNPKPEHRAYRDALHGFYGEYLEDTPGVRETVTVLGNASGESEIEGSPGAFGASSVILGPRRRLARVTAPEYATDDFHGAPAHRLRFGTGTRLCYFNLPLHHELDPRTSHQPLKVHAVLHLRRGAWAPVEGAPAMAELPEHGRR
jgi:mutator protein MutT